MEFGPVLARISGFLETDGDPWALVGGVALAAYGLARTTLDLDLVVEREVQEKLVAFMESEGYDTLYRSVGYSNHLHDDPCRGRVDFVYVDSETSARLFPCCRKLAGPGGVEVPVPKPEHLIAMKVYAMKQDPARTFQEMADIRHLLLVPGVDRDEVRDYFRKNDLESRYHELEATL